MLIMRPDDSTVSLRIYNEISLVCRLALFFALLAKGQRYQRGFRKIANVARIKLADRAATAKISLFS